MDYQLVLQFKGRDLPDFDALVNLEDALQRLVESTANVDGHDMGSGEMNIFVLTGDPAATFEQVKPLLFSVSLLNKVSVAYREISSDDLTVIWPQSSMEAFLVA
jgi:hypothetical protein